MAGPAVLVAHQPAYLPWGGYFSRLLDVDELVVLDHVQFSERGWQHRNFVRGTPSRVRLTVPVRHRFGQSLGDVRLADEPWAERHWRTLTDTYRQAPHWPRYADELKEIYDRRWDRLVPLTLAVTELMLSALGLKHVTIVCSSTLAPQGVNTEMLVDLCRQRGARVLRVGTGAASYLDMRVLQRHGITVEVATYTHPPYGTPSPRWEPGLSALDLLLHEGSDARAVLERGARTTAWTAELKAVTA